MKRWQKRIPAFLILVLASTSLFSWYVLFREGRGNLLTVVVFDVGQGDSIFIEAPNGNQVLFDGGPDTSVLRELGNVMPFYDRSIDMILVTNPDKDHIAGLVDVLDRYKVEHAIEPGTLTATAVYRAYTDKVKAERVPLLVARAGDRIMLDKKRSVYIDVLFPDRDVAGLSTNDGSIVVKLVYKETCFILTGDTTDGVEEYLADLYGPALDCQVLKVAHHGSRTSSSPKFVAAVSPEYAVISSGKGNTYGHPHTETLDTLQRFGAKILRTDERGSIRFTSDGGRISVQ